MDIKTLNEIMACLPRERTLFRYFRGRYALLLLQAVVGDGRQIQELKRSAYASLLEKPEVKQALAMAGQGVITHAILDSVWPAEVFHFVITLGGWGTRRARRVQTTRRGYNLVLQLNFSSQHDDIYRALVKPIYTALLNTYSHPILRPGARTYFRETMGWSRIDLDLQRGEALIEEVQNDWLREARILLRDARRKLKKHASDKVWWDTNGKVEDVIRYCEQVLQPYYHLWDEAVLAASIDFIHRELGIRKIYYHTAQYGYRLKGIRYTQPPKSLYSQLPRRFCFTQTEQMPEFLAEDKYFRRVYRRVERPNWYRLEI